MNMPKPTHTAPLSIVALAIMFFLIAGLLSACGQKGDLYLPNTTHGHADDRFLLHQAVTNHQLADEPTDTATSYVLQDNPTQAY